MRLIGGQMVRNWLGDVQDLKRGSISERGGSNRKWECHHFAHYLSSNVNEVISAVINSLFIFCSQKDFTPRKMTESSKSTKSTITQPSKSTKTEIS